MNILIPDSWLREHLETKAKPEQIKEYLSLCGPSVERISEVDGEPVYDIEVTTNRVDCMSVQGIAREAAVVLPEFGVEARLKVIVPTAVDTPTSAKLKGPLKRADEESSQEGIKLEIVNDPQLCNRIMAVVMEVTQGPSPEWMQKRLEAVGIRSLNNLIDITNYVMMEIGHPTHVFDWDRLNTSKLRVRESKKGEQITTLDNKTFTLPGGDILIEDDKGRIVDLPGIMGLENSVVTDQTKQILFFIDNNDPARMRKTSMSLSLRSEAVTRNEKGIDLELAEKTMLRGIELYQQHASGKLLSEIIDVYPNMPTLKTTQLSLEKVNEYLGIEVDPQRIENILKALGCEVKRETNNVKRETLSLTPPSWRANDLQIPQDYIEEIARIYGYHRLPSTLMATAIPDHPSGERFDLEYKIKTWLTDWGLQEIYTYSLVSANLAEQSGFALAEHLQLKNPLSAEWQYLRRSLIPSHGDLLSQQPVGLFEMASVYHPRPNDLPEEELHLTMTTNNLSFTHIRGLLDALMVRLYISNFEVIPVSIAPGFMAERVGQLRIAGEVLGHIGQSGWYQDRPIYTFDLLVQPLLQIARSYPVYQPLSSYPPIIEDFTFTFPEETHLGPVIEVIKKTDTLIAKVNLINSFETAHTFRVHFQSGERNLSAEDVLPVRKRLVEMVEKEFKAKLKG